MIFRLFLLIAITALTTTSCSTTVYYQLYKATPVNKSNQQGNFIYEDESCKVTYNFWSEAGNAGFIFYNKTNENITINLSDSYFVLNDFAYDYFKNRIYTTSNEQSLSIDKKTTAAVQLNGLFVPLFGMQSLQKGIVHSSGSSIAITESKIVCVPAKTSKIISEFSINELRIKNCNLLKYPSKKQVSPVNYTKDDSPLVFSNRISYNVGTGNTVKFQNEFYISEISNHPSSEFFSVQRSKECGESKSVNTSNYISADKFYISYNKGVDAAKY